MTNVLQAATNDEMKTIKAKPPNTDEIIFGCEKVFPFVMIAVTHATWRFVEFENIRKSARPSKSGMAKAMANKNKLENLSINDIYYKH